MKDELRGRKHHLPRTVPPRCYAVTMKTAVDAARDKFPCGHKCMPVRTEVCTEILGDPKLSPMSRRLLLFLRWNGFNEEPKSHAAA